MSRANPLKGLRAKLGLSQAEVAKRVGVSQPNYQRWESGAAPVPASKLKKLAKVLHSTEEVVSGRARYAIVSPAILGVQDGYWGEATVHFRSGTPAIVASISASEYRRLAKELLNDDLAFLEIVGLCNETYLVRRQAISDVYLSDEAVDTVSPAEEECEEFLPIPLVDDRLWDVLSRYERQCEEWRLPRADVAEALSYFMRPEEVAAELAAGWPDKSDVGVTEAAGVEAFTHDLFRKLGIATSNVDGSVEEEERKLRERFLLGRSCYTVLRLTRGAQRRLVLRDEDDLAGNYEMLRGLPEGERGLIVMRPDDDQVGVIYSDALDYVRFPQHYLRRALGGSSINLYGEVDEDDE